MRGIKLFCLVVLTAALVVAVPKSAHGAAEFIPPVIAKITRQFDMSNGEFGAGHRGVDFAVPEGTPVLASGAGTVTFAGGTPEGPYVTVRHDGDVETTYALGRIDVTQGQHVTQGTVLGVSGQGHAGSPVLHFGAKVAGKYVDPLMLLRDFDDITDLIGLVQVPEEPPGQTVAFRPVSGPVFGRGGLDTGGLRSGGVDAGGLGAGGVGSGDVGTARLNSGGLGIGGVTAGGIGAGGIGPETLFVPSVPDLTAGPRPAIDLDPHLSNETLPQSGPKLRGPRLPSKFYEDDGFDGEGGVGFGRPFDPKTGLPRFNDPRRIKELWGGLTDEARKSFIRRFPRQIGHMVGIPVADRDRANRHWLDLRIKQLEAAEKDREKALGMGPGPSMDFRFDYPTPLARFSEDLSKKWEGLVGLTPWRRRMTALSRELYGARNLKKQLNLVQGDPKYRLQPKQVFLMEVDTKRNLGDGQAAISVGDPTTAQHIGVVVPGINSALHKIQGPLGNAAILRSTVHDRLGTDLANGTASIAWLGYDSPNGLLDATNDAEAREGAPRLVKFVDGVRADHARPAIRPGYAKRGERDPHISFFGHSYGSLVSGLATRFGADVDDPVLFGSPGGGTQYGSELKRLGRQVWTTRTPDDIIDVATLVPVLGRDPTDEEFGAKYVPLGSDQKGHGGYFKPDSLGLLNFARILTGRFDEVEGERDV